ncbi:hypothetical protein [Paenibacillus silvae]|uniref:hypothetical protein n=1 Tax=Paenibacillus silvae TaxID=1325358 RepID=UPI0011A7A41F|nr:MULTISPECIES: hypothetical protein [Paenibacillus]MCK6074647.1 hypothetical protein [Paenibacillus silvae]MCK6147878.1 hypothetical protein [Paenibacillus silvae]MCK6266176.1 hypothetical protein [Paenibacillus silvae]
MIEWFTNYLNSNWIDMIKDILIGLIGGLILAQKSRSDEVNNQTTVRESVHYITQTVVINYPDGTRRPEKRKKTKSSEDDNSIIGVIAVVAVILSYLYVKYHSELMSFMTSLIIIGVVGTLTVAVKLYRNNSYDNLNRLWTLQLIGILVFDCVQLVVMSKQDTTLISTISLSDFFTSAGLEGVARFGIIGVGFVISLLPNVLLFILLIHMLSVNLNRAFNDRVTAFFIRHTVKFTTKPYHMLVVVVLLCGFSLFYSTGYVYDLVQFQQDNFMNQLEQSLKINTK